MLKWNTKHFPLNLQSGLTLSNFRDVGGGFELRNQIRHCKTVCIERNLYLINYNRMRTQRTTKGIRDAGSSCLCDRGLHRYLRNFGGGGGLNTLNPPSRYATAWLCWWSETSKEECHCVSLKFYTTRIIRFCSNESCFWRPSTALWRHHNNHCM